MRQAQRDLATRNRDLGFLPEGEIHSRSIGSTPFDMAREANKYPFERVFAAAELASSLEAGVETKLAAAMGDSDSAVRWWGALGYLMRGAPGVAAGKAQLRGGLKDESPYVRIASAEALARFGEAGDLQPALDALGQLAQADKQGVLVSVYALNAVDALRKKAGPLLSVIRPISGTGPSPDARYNSYVPRLVAGITENLGGEPPAAPAAKAKGKGKGKGKK
jgi:uncharacterized sulfatase